MAKKLLIKNIGQLVTCKGSYPKTKQEMSELSVIEQAAVVCIDGKIAKVGKESDVLANLNATEFKVVDAMGNCVLPGFIDAHTHFVFGGNRAEEFSWRLKGVPYMEIMERGGGIVNTVKATRATTKETLVKQGLERLRKMAQFGVTTVEGKSGYGLDEETELKQLAVMQELNNLQALEVVPTFMGAHAVPMEYKGKTDEFVSYLIKEVLPQVKRQGIAEFCDVFCEKGVFEIEQSRKILEMARGSGLKLKIHADEIVALGGAELAAEMSAVSAEHLLQISATGMKEMAEKGVVAVLLPATAFSLREPYAKAREMIEAGVSIAVATDFNPGSCCTYSIPLVIALSTLYMGLTVEETITALTINAASALKREKTIGSIEEGKQADLIILEYPTYDFLSYYIGLNIVKTVIKKGEVLI